VFFFDDICSFFTILTQHLTFNKAWNNVISTPPKSTTAVGQVKKRKRQDRPHHGQLVGSTTTRGEPVPPAFSFPSVVWLWLLEFHLKRTCDGAEEIIPYPFYYSFSLIFIVLDQLLVCKVRFAGEF